MNILCLDQFNDLGGAQRCLLDLLPALANAGWSVHVAAPGSGPLAERAVALGATADSIHCGPYTSGSKTKREMARFAWEVPRLAFEIRRLMHRYQADLLYVNGPRLLPAAALADFRGPPLIFHSHSYLDGYAVRLAGWSLQWARASLVACSKFVAAPLLPYARRGLHLVYNGVSSAMMAPLRGLRTPPSIGVIGRIAPEKGQHEFLRAARLVLKDAPWTRFLICGAPLFSDTAALRYCTELDAIAAGLPVEFCGWQEDIAAVLARLDLLVVPSTGIEATPRIILEAFAAGVPVVAFASGGIPEIIDDNQTGFLVKDPSPEALAATLRELLRAPDRLSEVAASAQQKAAGDFSLERYQAHMLEALEAASCRAG